MANELHLRVVTPDRTVFDRKVAFVSFMGVDGSYGILPNHAPLMTATAAGIVKIQHTDGQIEQMLISSGFAEVRDNTLSLLCLAGEMAHEVDPKRAEEAERRARERIAQAEGGKENVDLPRAREALQRAVLRQLLAKRGGTGGMR